MRSERPQVLLVTRAIVLKENKQFLLIRRAPTETYSPNLWECPGGKLDKGQELAHAFEREVLEETGILAEPTARMAFVDSFIVEKGPYKGMPYVGLFTIGRSLGGKLTLSEEHTEHKWVGFDEALEMELTPETRKALIVLKDYL